MELPLKEPLSINGLRQELINFCRNTTVELNPLVSIEEVSLRLEKADMGELIDLTIMLMGGALNKLNKIEEVNKEQ